MTEYENLWTKLHLGKLRGNKLFKSIWRAARVGIVTSIMFFVKSILPEFELNPMYIPLIATAVEKVLRELFPMVDF